MKVPFTEKERVLRSPYYMGSRLWDRLDSAVQLFPNMFEFKTAVKKKIDGKK